MVKRASTNGIVTTAARVWAVRIPAINSPSPPIWRVSTKAAVAVGMGAAVAAVLRLPLTAVLLAVILTASAGLGTSALIIVGVVISFLIVNALSPPEEADPQEGEPQQDPAPG